MGGNQLIRLNKLANALTDIYGKRIFIPLALRDTLRYTLP
jgi:hypothetical protein